MLRFNTFRAQRYLRSKFVEGKYLLASEATDLELEIMDLLRQTVVATLGDDVAIEDAWKVERLSATQILINPGEAWFKGLPFVMRTGKDQQVSGAILSLGTVPVGVTASDDANGGGKVITFNSGGTTPTNLYRLVITAREELLTDVDDPFLKNVNLTESTAQKIRLVFQLNIVPESLQTESPVPYRDENSTSLSVTNFPNTGGVASPNFVNQITVTPSSGQNGELIALNLISGSEGIDGRDLELVLRNNTGLGGGNPIPNSPTGQAAFSNGKLIDSNSNIFHVNAIFNDTVSTQVVIRIDKEPDQPNPEIVNGKAFTLMKRDVFVTDDVNGSPQGRLHWAFSTLDWHQSNGIVHDSRITDLRNVVLKNKDFQENVNERINLIPTGGGNVSFGVSAANQLSWTSDITILNSFGPSSIIEDNTVAILEDGALIYVLDLESGGVISRGNLSVTILTGGATVTVAALDDLSDVRLGNLIQVGSEIAEITSINNVAKQLQVTPAISGTGAATIYLDSFANATAALDEKSYVLAVRKNNKVWVGGGSLELEDGETNQLGDGVPLALLTYLGASDENDSSPFYSSVNIVTQGSPLTTAISDLDTAVDAINDALAEPIYDERLQFPSGLAANTNITLPNNSRNGGNPQFYTAADGLLEIYHNQLFKFQAVDWISIDNQTIQFNYDLPNDSEIHFRMDSIAGGTVGGGGGGGDLQDAYNVGRQITTSSGNPVEISGPIGEKLLVVNGDMEVTGVIDPTAIQFTPQNANPLQSGQRGLWINLNDELMMEDGVTNKNISQTIENLETGLGVTAITRLMFNGTGLVIPKGTPVYSPSPGEIAPANGSLLSTSRVLGVASENIAPSTNGMIAVVGVITGVSGYTHNSVIYLGDDNGELVDVEPTLGPYPGGFVVFIVGIMEGTNLYVRPQFVGVL